MKKTIPDFSCYQIDHQGNVFNKFDRLIAPFVDKDGRTCVRLKHDRGEFKSISVHRLVYETFVGPLRKNKHVKFHDGTASKLDLVNMVVLEEHRRLMWDRLVASSNLTVEELILMERTFM